MRQRDREIESCTDSIVCMKEGAKKHGLVLKKTVRQYGTGMDSDRDRVRVRVLIALYAIITSHGLLHPPLVS